MTQRSTLRTILENRKNFWKISGFEKTVEEQMKWTISMSIIFFKIFITFVCLLTAMFIMLPAFEGKYHLPLSTWMPEGYPALYEITYVVQAFMSVMCGVFVIGFDVLFAAICIELTMQFQLLKARFLSLASFEVRNVSEKIERLGKLKECVQYHAFLIRYVYQP